MPYSLATPIAASTLASSPEITICPGELILAISTSSSAASRRTSFSWPPIIAAMPPSVAAQASSMNSPRFCTSCSPAAKSNVPAAACAVISPRDKPAAQSIGKLPNNSRTTARAASECTYKAGWQFDVVVSASAGPFHIMSVNCRPRISSACANNLAAGVKSSANSRPIPTLCAPWPAKSSAIFFAINF